MMPKIMAGHEYIVDLDRFAVRVHVIKAAATRGWWECDTIPVGTRIIIEETAFRGRLAKADSVLSMKNLANQRRA